MAEPNSPEREPNNEATKTSKNWLQRTVNDVNRAVGNLALTAGGEFMTLFGTAVAPAGLALSLVTGNPLPALAGLIPTGIGTAVGWQGVKRAGGFEKFAYLTGKAATTGAVLMNPVWRAITIGFSIASTTFGLRKRA